MYYAGDLATVAALCRKHHIDYLVVEPGTLSRSFLQKKRPYFDPFNAQIKRLTQENARFALDNIPEEKKLFKHERYFVVRPDALLDS